MAAPIPSNPVYNYSFSGSDCRAYANFSTANSDISVGERELINKALQGPTSQLNMLHKKIELQQQALNKLKEETSLKKHPKIAALQKEITELIKEEDELKQLVADFLKKKLRTGKAPFLLKSLER